MVSSKLFAFASIALTYCISNVGAVPIQDDTTEVATDRRAPPPPRAVGRLFSIDNKIQYFSGVNTWWAGHLYYQADLEQAFNQLAASGIKTARVWAFGNTNNPDTEVNIFYQSLNSSGGFINYDENKGIGRLDAAVKLAAKLNIKLIMVLLNNYNDLGGINTYQTAFSLDKKSFFTDPKAQKAYRDYIKFIIKRYQNSGAIFSWELCNEPRCQECGGPDTLTEWARSTARYIKSIDNRHLVAVGDEGWLQPTDKIPGNDGTYPYSGYEGVDHIALSRIPWIDYATVHMYPQRWGKDYSWGSTWIAQHNEIGKCINKPVVLEEYGAPAAPLRATWVPQWQATILQNTSIASDSLWQFGSQFPEENPFDEYAVYWSADPNSEYQKLIVGQAKAMAAKAPRAVA